MASVYYLYGTYEIADALLKNGVPWPDIGDYTITLELLAPDGTLSEYAATVEDEDEAIVCYTTTTTDLDQIGMWARSWHIVGDGVDDRTTPVFFRVDPAPGYSAV